MIKLIQKEPGGKGYVDKKIVKRLLDDKILWDRSVHNLYSEPSLDSLQQAAVFIRGALAELKIDELR
ncbi:MAG: hypothetical protein E4H14_11250 [Candidatus Thorarchaeota archaeon]|nr:MAG: hypothetical protein E4H14_11250 [Candidatus Thorarchaeota archaeon]